MTFLCVLLLAGQLPGAAQPASSASAITAGEFVSALDSLTAGLSDASTSEAIAVTATVPLRWRVTTGTLEIVIDGTWIIHAVRDAAATPAEWPDRRKQIVARLGEIRGHAADRAGADRLGTTRQNARSVVQTVLARHEFQPARETWVSALLQRIGEWLRAVLERIGAGGLARRQSAIVLAWIAALAAFAGLGLWLARVLDRPQRGVTLGLSRRTPPSRVSAREWTYRALTAFGAGHTREGTRCAYNAAIRRVEEEGGWRIDETRTPREYLPLLRSNDPRRAPVKEVTEQFERVWYGNRAVSEEDIRSLTTNLEKLGCPAAAD